VARVVPSSLGLAASILLLLGLSPSTLARTTDGCPTRHQAAVVMRTAQLVVFRRVTKPSPGDVGTITTWTACWRPTGRRTTLLEGEDIPGADTTGASFFRASGRYVAYLGSYGSHYGDKADSLWLLNARTARTYPIAEVGYKPAYSPVGGNQLLALRLNERGFLGWKVLLSSGDSVIWAHDSRGNRLLDSSPNKFGPLNLTGDRLTWSLNRDRRSAILS
jgi:hypothetical protein